MITYKVAMTIGIDTPVYQCPVCGSLVLDADRHDEWHSQLARVAYAAGAFSA